jgi:hypothetical protein
MFSPKAADGRLQVQIPTPADDRPSWTKVGVITAIGFIVGIAWPRVMGVRLGPSVPADVASAAAATSGAPAETSSSPSAPAVAAAPASPTAAAPSVAAAVVAAAPAPPSVTVGHGVVFACKSSDGDSMKGSDCGTLPGLDGLVMPRLRKLSECADAVSASGKLHLVAHIDFGRGSLSVDLGRGQTVSSPDALLACAKSDVTGVTLGGVAHDNPRYSVAYTVTFDTSSGAAPSDGTGSATAAARSPVDVDGSAQVVWEVAIVRDAPKTGKVLARLQRGTTVHLGSAKDGWYPVKFGDGFGSDGWLYRGAIGR